MPPRRENWVDWRNCPGRQVLLEDLADGTLPLDASVMSEEEAWETYRHCVEFEGVEFSQFKARLKDHRKQIGASYGRSTEEMEAMLHDRMLKPRKKYNHRGEPVFDVDPAKLLLREDVEQGKHETMTPMALQATREEYMRFDRTKFKERIYQEVRYQKMVRHLERERAKKLATFADVLDELPKGAANGN